MNHQINHCQQNHSFTTGGQRFVVLAQTSVLTQPGQGTLDHPATRQYLEALHVVTTLDDLQAPIAKFCRPVQKSTSISAIGPNQRQPAKMILELAQHQSGPVTILNICRVYDNGYYQTQRIYNQMPLSPCYFLTSVITAIPPFEAVLTVWLSIMAALGLACRPASSRTRSWRLS